MLQAHNSLVQNLVDFTCEVLDFSFYLKFALLPLDRF